MAYPNLNNLSDDAGIGTLLAVPNASFPFFWTFIIFGIGALIASSLYFNEKRQNLRGNLISSSAIASLVVVVLAVLGSLVGIITLEAMIPLLVFSLMIMAIWFFS